MRRWFRLLPTVLSAASVAAFISTRDAQAQAVAFQPVVSSFPQGVMLSTTPVVSADRRYVRLGVTATSTELLGFDAYPVPAAVSGGGAGGFGGVGLGAGAGGFGGFRAGLNGVIGPQAIPESSPDLLAQGMGQPSPHAAAMLNGMGGFSPPPRLSAGMPAAPQRPRVVTSKKSRKALPKRR